MILRVSLLVFLSVLLVSGTAAAAPSLRDDLDGESRQAFDDGTRLYKAGRYEEARVRFTTAYQANGDRRILFNVAVCDKALGHNARAVQVLEESLADRAKLPADYVEHAEEAMVALRAHVAMLTIETSVPDPIVTIDGQPPATTARAVLVDEGSHLVVAEKPGYRTASGRVVAVGGKEAHLALVLAPEREAPRVARLHVTSDHADDTFAVDERARVLGPVDVELEPGEHTVVVARPGGGSKKISVVLREGDSRDLRLSLPDQRPSGISPWWFVAGGVVVAGIATTAILVATRPTRFEGSNAGTLNPYIVTASYRGGPR